MSNSSTLRTFCRFLIYVRVEKNFNPSSPTPVSNTLPQNVWSPLVNSTNFRAYVQVLVPGKYTLKTIYSQVVTNTHILYHNLVYHTLLDLSLSRPLIPTPPLLCHSLSHSVFIGHSTNPKKLWPPTPSPRINFMEALSCFLLSHFGFEIGVLGSTATPPLPLSHSFANPSNFLTVASRRMESS